MTKLPQLIPRPAACLYIVSRIKTKASGPDWQSSMGSQKTGQVNIFSNELIIYRSAIYRGWWIADQTTGCYLIIFISLLLLIH
jgi:hypothetical protein